MATDRYFEIDREQARGQAMIDAQLKQAASMRNLDDMAIRQWAVQMVSSNSPDVDETVRAANKLFMYVTTGMCPFEPEV